MGQVLRYTAMLLRAYSRDWTALFFGFFFPLIFMSLFGILNFGAFGSVNVGIVDDAKNDQSAVFVSSLGKIETLKIVQGVRDDEVARLNKGDRDLVLIVPADFRIAPARAGQAVPTLTLYTNSARAEQVAVGSAILNQVVDQMSFAVTQTAPVLAIKREELAGRNLKYVDFLTPGIVGMTIMQLGISSVAFAFVVARRRGVIRRIMATPISRRNFMAAHVLQRLILAVIQVLILLGVAVLFFKVTIVGSIATLLAIAILGAVVFLCIGFAVTGLLTTEDQAATITQLVTLPQMFLSGVFFSRDAVPAFLKPIANFLPLTFLNDALRDISTAGATVSDVGGQIVGLLAWSVVSFVLAFRFFKLD